MAIIATGTITIADLSDGHSGGRNYIRNSKNMIYEDRHRVIEDTAHANTECMSGEIEVMDGSIDYALRMSDFNNITYRLDTLPHINGEYIYSVWVKPPFDMDVKLNVLGLEQTFPLESDDGWTRLELYNPSPTSDYVDITPMYSGTASGTPYLYFYESMLELGDVATDWKPAPEDTEEAVNDIQTDVAQLMERVSNAELLVRSDHIVSTVMESSVYSTDVSGRIENRVASEVTQRNNAIDAAFTTVTQTYGSTKDYVDEAKTNIRFDSDGIHIGKSNDPFEMDLSNQKLSFKDNGNEVAYISNQVLSIQNAKVLSRFAIGKFAFVPTDTGMALIYIGDEN